jgi:hypothetical protein
MSIGADSNRNKMDNLMIMSANTETLQGRMVSRGGAINAIRSNNHSINESSQVVM